MNELKIDIIGKRRVKDKIIFNVECPLPELNDIAWVQKEGIVVPLNDTYAEKDKENQERMMEYYQECKKSI